jgi:lipoprotein-releasing system ATP-binding protein
MTDAASSSPILHATRVHKSFQMGESTLEVLKDVNLSIRPGEFLAIEGRSGSGKSTLLHILGGLDAPDAGEVRFEGEDIAELSRRAAMHRGKLQRMERGWRFVGPFVGLFHVTRFAIGLAVGGKPDRHLARLRNTRFGFVFQFYHLLPELNVLENTMLSVMLDRSVLAFNRERGSIRARATKVLEDLGMGHRLTHRPSQLSGGERQRVAIARALMNQPRVLFADEPTGNLDAETGRQIMAVLEGLHRDRGQTIVMVTHDRSIAHRADRVLVLKDGRLAGAGPADGS